MWRFGVTLRQEIGGTWPVERKQLFLLRSNVQRVLSFDESVWPVCGLAEDLGPKLTVDYTKHSCDFVQDLFEIKAVPTTSPVGCVLVGVIAPQSDSLLSEESEDVFAEFQDCFADIPEASRWLIHGFDVVEARLGLSGLSNTGFSESEKSELGANFADDLNDVGLFVRLDRALAFAKARTGSVPGHAPFVPVGLLSIKAASG